MTSRPDVLIVGAGLAGLSAAVTVQRAGFNPLVVEGTDRVGGRVRTDVINGFRIDHGFQVFNPAYPTARALLNYDALKLNSFSPGVRVVQQDGEAVLGNPLRDASYFVTYAKSLRKGGISALGDVAKFGIYAGLAAAKSSPDMFDCSARETLQRAGLSDDFIDHTVKPFLTGVFLENGLETSRRFLDFVLEYFIKGVPALPAEGMAAIPLQLTGLLHADAIRLNTWTHGVDEKSINTDEGHLVADAVIVATDQDTAGAWSGTQNHGWRSVTTWYHAFPSSEMKLVEGKALLTVDGQHRGPVINTVPLTHAATSYAPSGMTLVSSSTLGTDSSASAESAVRQHLALLYGVNTESWTTVTSTLVHKALPRAVPPFTVHADVPVSNGVFIAGDHLRQPSIEGAMASGVAAGRAAVAKLRGR